jgi:hypothetical protein
VIVDLILDAADLEAFNAEFDLCVVAASSAARRALANSALIATASTLETIRFSRRRHHLNSPFRVFLVGWLWLKRQTDEPSVGQYDARSGHFNFTNRWVSASRVSSHCDQVGFQRGYSSQLADCRANIGEIFTPRILGSLFPLRYRLRFHRTTSITRVVDV